MPTGFESTLRPSSYGTARDVAWSEDQRRQRLLDELLAQEQLKTRLADPLEKAKIEATVGNFQTRKGVREVGPVGRNQPMAFTEDNFPPMASHVSTQPAPPMRTIKRAVLPRVEPGREDVTTQFGTSPQTRTIRRFAQSDTPVDPDAAMGAKEKAMLDPKVLAALAVSPKKDEARLDRSYQLNNTAIEGMRKPLADQAARMSRLVDTVNQMTPQADALVAPELMTVMAGGQGSGLRINEAEIARMMGGRTNLEGLKAALNKWQLDPSKGLSITPAQRGQVRALIADVSQRSSAKLDDINRASQDLIDTTDVDAHRRIVADLRRNLDDLNTSASIRRGGMGGTVSMVAPDGRQLLVPLDKVAELEAAGAKRR